MPEGLCHDHRHRATHISLKVYEYITPTAVQSRKTIKCNKALQGTCTANYNIIEAPVRANDEQ